MYLSFFFKFTSAVFATHKQCLIIYFANAVNLSYLKDLQSVFMKDLNQIHVFGIRQKHYRLIAQMYSRTLY